MEKKLEEVVEKMAEKAKGANAAQAMHYTQAMLNVVNALIMLKHKEK